MKHPLTLLAIGLTHISWQSSSFGQPYDILNIHTPVHEILTESTATTAAIHTCTSTYFVDGSVTSHPTETKTFDRSLINLVQVGTGLSFTGPWRFRMHAQAEKLYRKEEGEHAPRKVLEEDSHGYQIDAAITYAAANGNEVVVGYTHIEQPAFKRSIATPAIESTEKLSTVKLENPYFALVKRNAAVVGGFFYNAGSETSRTSEISINDAATSLSFEDKVHTPPYVGIFARYSAGITTYGFSFDAVEAGSSGSRTDNGDTVYEDYQRLHLEFEYGTGTALRFLTLISHRTLSYADQRNVTFPSLPMSGAHFQLALGSESSYTYGGIFYGHSSDGQSLPEFNASYAVTVVGGTVGLNLAF